MSTQLKSPAGAMRTAQIVGPGAGILGATDAPALPRVEVKLAASDGLGFSVVDYLIPPRFSPPPVLHRQTGEDVAVYVVHGQLHYWFEDGDAIAVAGSLVRLPRLAWNRWANETDEPCRILAIFAPPGFEQYFLELSAALAAGGDPAAAADVIGELRERYGDEEQASPAGSEERYAER
jgi:quercetin dioxygenase-like cupin family protein